MCWSPNPQCDFNWRWGLYGSYIRSWGWGPDDEISAVIRRDNRKLADSLYSLWGHSEKVAVCKPGKEPSLKHQTCWHPDLGVSSFQNYEKINFCCLSHPVYSILLWNPRRLIRPMKEKNIFLTLLNLAIFPFTWCCCKFWCCLNEVQREKENRSIFISTVHAKFLQCTNSHL